MLPVRLLDPRSGEGEIRRIRHRDRIQFTVESLTGGRGSLKGGSGLIDRMEANRMHWRWTFRLRTAMLLVLLIALTCFGGLILRRRHHYLERRSSTPARRNSTRTTGGSGSKIAAAAACRELNPPNHSALSGHHEGLAQKYQQAAQRPWLAIEPDPRVPGG